jgi:peptidoglycan lytic transglycosylase A
MPARLQAPWKRDAAGRALVRPPARLLPVVVLAAAVWLHPSHSLAADEETFNIPDTQLEPLQWSELDGWAADDLVAAFAAFRTSCHSLAKFRNAPDPRPIARTLWETCRRAVAVRVENSQAARAFFEDNFRPVRIAKLGEADGFLTGYFEPIVQGSRFPNPEFHIPLYRRPRDLVALGHRTTTEAFPNKNVRVSRRNERNELVPYHDRAAIEAGALDGQKLEICWLKDSFEALSISIQGSARVILEDGTPLRINYDSYNGYSYSSIGRVLVERHLVPSEEMSMQRIRDWMAANPEEAPKLRATNRSYIFFRITGLSNDGEPVGGEGVPLTPGRSIAVDKMHAYGTPFFIQASVPVESANAPSLFRRLMIAQDTGSAIVGPARADLYWGSGDAAGRIAGRIRHAGRFVMLLPRELDLVAAGKQMPLPVPKPNIPEVEVKLDAGEQVPLPVPKPKIPGVEVNLGGDKQVPLPVPKPTIPEAEVKHDAGTTKVQAERTEAESKAAKKSRRQAYPWYWRYRL